MLRALRHARGLWRSVRVYHLAAGRRAALDRLYERFLRPGDLAFDIGAHVGDRTASFRRLGARVVAVEPQPGPAAVIRLVRPLDRDMILVRAAVGAHEGRLSLQVNSANPTVTTGSRAFVAAAAGAGNWADEVWDETIEVPMVTLDGLIARFGEPAFIKIDVEGFEPEVLAGLSRPVRALSFEFTTLQREAALRALDRLGELGRFRFTLSLGETLVIEDGEPVSAQEMARRIAALPHAVNSGDVYAVLA